MDESKNLKLRYVCQGVCPKALLPNMRLQGSEKGQHAHTMGTLLQHYEPRDFNLLQVAKANMMKSSQGHLIKYTNSAAAGRVNSSSKTTITKQI